jgi:uncharacterized protein YbaR (Trm112 family)
LVDIGQTSQCRAESLTPANLHYHSDMDSKMLELLVCPVTKGHLDWDKERQELRSRSARLAYPVRDGIPVLLENEARILSNEELETIPTRTPLV